MADELAWRRAMRDAPNREMFTIWSDENHMIHTKGEFGGQTWDHDQVVVLRDWLTHWLQRDSDHEASVTHTGCLFCRQKDRKSASTALGRIKTIHQQRSGLCAECGRDWPCETVQIAKDDSTMDNK